MAIGAPLAHVPGSRCSSVDPGQLQVSETVTGTSCLRQIGHVPALSTTVDAWIGQVQAGASRTGTSASLQIGQMPGAVSMTSGWCGHVIDSGGRGVGALRPRCAMAAAVNSTMTHPVVSSPRRRALISDLL